VDILIFPKYQIQTFAFHVFIAIFAAIMANAIDDILNDASVLQLDEVEIGKNGCSPENYSLKWSIFLSKQNESDCPKELALAQLDEVRHKIENALDYSRLIKQRSDVFIQSGFADKEGELNIDRICEIRYIDIVFAFNGCIRDIYAFVLLLSHIKRACANSPFFYLFAVQSIEVWSSDGSNWNTVDRLYLDEIPLKKIQYNDDFKAIIKENTTDTRRLYKMFTYIASGDEIDMLADSTEWLLKFISYREILDDFNPDIGDIYAMKPQLTWNCFKTQPVKLDMSQKNSRYFWKILSMGSIGWCHRTTDYFIVNEINKAIADGRLSGVSTKYYMTSHKGKTYFMHYLGRIFIKQERSHLDVTLLIEEENGV
jgi:hypothetical protein